jgi:glucokinase
MTTARRALALDIGGTKLAAAIVDDRGVPCRVTTAATDAAAGAEQALERAVSLAESVLAAERDAGGDVVAVGVSTIGITRADQVLLAPNVPGWDKLRIPARLAGAFGGLPVTVINDVKAATLAELTWGTLSGTSTGLYVNLGTGVGAGLVVGGHVVTGANGAAGEVGYLAPAIPHHLAEGSGPVEQLIGGLGAAARASQELGYPVTVADLFAAAGDSATAVLGRLLDDIGLWVANLAVVLDPEVVSLGGGFMRTPAPVLDRVRQVTELIAPFPPVIVAARYGADAALAGAGAAALTAAAGEGA